MFNMTASPTATHGEMKTYEKDTPYGSLAMYIHSLEDKEEIESTPELEEEIANLLIDISQKHLQESEFTEYGSNRKRRKVSETEDSDMDYKEFEEVNVVGGEEEDFYVEEELDDDWKDSRNALMTSSMISPKNSRKKAPSGTACEKHKRWKKRCPEDCPMRKQKSKKLSPTLSRKSRYSEDSNSDQDDIAEDRTMYIRRKRMPENFIENVSDEDFEGRIAPIKRRNGGRRPIGATIACERHTAMHARCPPHCPDRRPSGSNRIKKSRDSDDSDFDSNSDMSPVNNLEEFEENKDNFTTEDEIKNVLFSKFSEELPKSPRIQMKALVGDVKIEATSPTSTRKSPKAQRNKGTRKYLPQACDRHKMLHAKCPANCPDRMKRDLEKGLAPFTSVTSPPTLTVTLIAHN